MGGFLIYQHHATPPSMATWSSATFPASRDSTTPSQREIHDPLTLAAMAGDQAGKHVTELQSKFKDMAEQRKAVYKMISDKTAIVVRRMQAVPVVRVDVRDGLPEVQRALRECVCWYCEGPYLVAATDFACQSHPSIADEHAERALGQVEATEVYVDPNISSSCRHGKLEKSQRSRTSGTSSKTPIRPTPTRSPLPTAV
jgi:hypothetical protein